MALGLFLLFFSLFLLLILEFSMDLRFNLRGTKADYTVRLRLGRHRIRLPEQFTTRMSRMAGNIPLEGIENILASIKLFRRTLDYFFQKIPLLQLKVFYGLEDPYLSAIACGGLWSIVGAFLNYPSLQARLQQQPEVMVEPNFEAVGFQVDLYCIFQFRLGHIIIKELKRLSHALFI